MSHLQTGRDVITRALEKIGRLSINETAAQPNDVKRAAQWLDMVLGHFGGMLPTLWLFRRITATLPAGVNSADLATLFGASYPKNGVDFIATITAQATVTGGNPGPDEPLEILTSEGYETIDRKDQTGTPTAIYVDRTSKPTLRWWPQVDPATNTSVTVTALVQTFSDDLSADPGKLLQVRQAYSLWLSIELAAQLGSGPIVMMTEVEKDGLRKHATDLWLQLRGFAGQETARPRQTVYTDF